MSREVCVPRGTLSSGLNISCFFVVPTLSVRNTALGRVASYEIETYELPLGRGVNLDFSNSRHAWVSAAALAGLLGGLTLGREGAAALGVAMSIAVVEGERRWCWTQSEERRSSQRSRRAVAFLLPPMAFSVAELLRSDELGSDAAAALWGAHLLGWGLLELGFGAQWVVPILVGGCWGLPAIVSGTSR